MNKFKLGFTQTLKAEHEITIETDLNEDEAYDKLETIKFNNCWNVQDCANLVEEKLGEVVVDITEGDESVDDMEYDAFDNLNDDDENNEDDKE